MWTNGSADVWRSEAQTVIRARAGRRSINSRGAEVERSEVREWRVTQARRLTAIDRDFGASVPRAPGNVTDTKRTSEGRASERAPVDLARAPARRKAVGRCWCRRWRGGPERALGAALASGLNGAGDLATRAVGCLLGGAVAKSPRLALERLQCNHSATLFARRARGKSGRLEVWRVPGEKGAASRRAQWRGGCCVGWVVLWGSDAAAFRRGVAGWAGSHSQQRGAGRGVCGRVRGGGVVVRGNGSVAHVTGSAALRGVVGRCCVVAGWMCDYSIYCRD
jgi:hypothetical protein